MTVDPADCFASSVAREIGSRGSGLRGDRFFHKPGFRFRLQEILRAQTVIADRSLAEAGIHLYKLRCEIEKYDPAIPRSASRSHGGRSVPADDGTGWIPYETARWNRRGARMIGIEVSGSAFRIPTFGKLRAGKV